MLLWKREVSDSLAFLVVFNGIRNAGEFKGLGKYVAPALYVSYTGLHYSMVFLIFLFCHIQNLVHFGMKL